MDEIKIKVYGLFKVNRKQFIWGYSIIGSIFLILGILFIFIKYPIPEDVGKISRYFYEYPSLFWFFFLFWLIIEGQFYWTKFVKKQLSIIENQKKEILIQSKLISEKNQQITDSINYASRIQKSLLPEQNIFENHLNDYYVFFKPRDIVSGDFYWIREIKEKLIIVAADCTGHGVPGAFMSMLGISYLKEITDNLKNKPEQISASEIIEQLRILVKENLHQTNEKNSTKDGMDIAISVIDKKKRILQFSGANNPLILIRNNELIKHKGTANPVGVYLKEIPFTNVDIKYQENDKFYMFSDGFVDQFGGEKNKKFTSKKFKELLLSIHKKPMPEQKQIINKTFEKWKIDQSQVDDVLIIGFSL